MNANKFLPSNSLFEQKPRNWPPPPKVKSFFPAAVSDTQIDQQSNFTEYDIINSGSAQTYASSIFTADLSSIHHPASTITDPLKLESNVSITKENLGNHLSVGTSTYDDRKISSPSTYLKHKKGNPSFPYEKKSKQIPKLTQKSLFNFLNDWDNGSAKRRIELINKFLEDFTSEQSLDLDYYLCNSGSLILIRFIVGLQISFQLKKPVAHHFLAFEIFIKSLSGERYTAEFGLAGGFQTAFKVLRVAEMTNHDKMHVFHFLVSVLEGNGGSGAKRFLCSDTSYLECVVDCLTLCQDIHVLHEARLFLQNLCIGNTDKNLMIISKYVISLLPCDFNPQLQGIACNVLQGIISQLPEVASNALSLVVDVLKSNSDNTLVDVGNIGLVIMESPSALDFLNDLIQAVHPANLSENLHVPTSTQPAFSTGNQGEENYEEKVVEGHSFPPSLEQDPYFRLQYGAIYVLGFMVKNRTELAEMMIEKGIIGSLISAIGTPCYTSVQLEAIRLLLLLYELSSHCAIALGSLLPQKLLTALLEEHEDVLQYVTAVMCLILRKLGNCVQQNWTEWFTRINSSPPTTDESDFNDRNYSGIFSADEIQGETEGDEEENEKSVDVVAEIETLVGLLEKSFSDPFVRIIENMKLMLPDPNVISSYEDSFTKKDVRPSHHGARQDKVYPGQEYIENREFLEPFLKFLYRPDLIPTHIEDEFEKYYAAKFAMASKAEDDDDMNAMHVAALRDAEATMKTPSKDQLKPIIKENFFDDEAEGSTAQGAHTFASHALPSSSKTSSRLV